MTIDLSKIQNQDYIISFLLATEKSGVEILDISSFSVTEKECIVSAFKKVSFALNQSGTKFLLSIVTDKIDTPVDIKQEQPKTKSTKSKR